jgi:hypothetical protein
MFINKCSLRVTVIQPPAVTSEGVYFERAVSKEVGPSDTLGTAAGPPLIASHESDWRGAPEHLGELAREGEKAAKQRRP